MSAGALAAKASRYEAAMWHSLFAWITRRPRSDDPEERLFGYDKAAGPVLWAFVVLNFIEIPAVHFLIPWSWLRILLLVAGVWGTIWMVGVIAAVKISPHAVGTRGIRVRNGFLVDLMIPWEAIGSVSAGIRGSQSTKQLQIDGQRVSVVVTGQTNVTILLTRPIPLPLKGDEVEATEIRLYADDSAAMARAARELIHTVESPAGRPPSAAGDGAARSTQSPPISQ